jgi:diguanylate cyclase (GGDEF)-like protein
MIQNLLSQCDKEPIHLLSKIVNDKYLINFSYEFDVLQASKNCNAFFSIDDIVGKNITDFFDLPFIELFKTRLHLSKTDSFYATFEYGDCFYIVHIYDTHVILEFEKVQSDYAHRSFEAVIENYITQCDMHRSLKSSIDATVEYIGQISGFDRVMCYRFDEDYNGCVIAQRVQTMHENFLHHKFPASDIPAQARALYLNNKFRIIEDVHACSVEIYPTLNLATAEPLDLSQCYFRAVSQMHIDYLKNMNVGASMSISIVVEGKLWGLIVAHHPKPKSIAASSYKTYTILSSLISKQIEQNELLNRYERLFALKLKRELFLNAIASRDETTVFDVLKNEMALLQNIIECDECILYYDHSYFCYNNSFNANEIKALYAYVTEKPKLFVEHTLGQIEPSFLRFSHPLGGIACVRLSQVQNTYLMFLRYEQTQTLNWAGNPHKTVDENAILTPRNSFESWKELVHGSSIKFSTEEITSLKNLQKQLDNFIVRFNINSQASKLSKLNEKLRHQANSDPLTLLYNQRYFFELGVMHLKECYEKKSSCTLVVIELENLKEIKSKYGVEMTDLCLMNTANVMKNRIKSKNSLLARIGCEEFCALLFEEDHIDAQDIVLAIANDIRAFETNHSNAIVKIEVSTALVTYHRHLFRSLSEMLKGAQVLMQIKKAKP